MTEKKSTTPEEAIVQAVTEGLEAAKQIGREMGHLDCAEDLARLAGENAGLKAAVNELRAEVAQVGYDRDYQVSELADRERQLAATRERVRAATTEKDRYLAQHDRDRKAIEDLRTVLAARQVQAEHWRRTVEAVVHQLTTGEASDFINGSKPAAENDYLWCLEQLRDLVRNAPVPNASNQGALMITLTGLQYENGDVGPGPWKLYVYDASGYHDGGVWFRRGEVQYPDEEITLREASSLAGLAVAAGLEVRVCDGGDRLVAHGVGGRWVHGESFFAAVLEAWSDDLIRRGLAGIVQRQNDKVRS